MALIGKSDLDVFPLALGGNTFGWTSDEATSLAVLDAFVAGGGNFIDTADGYSAWAPGNVGGESESIIGRWLKARGNRATLVIATKVSQHPEFRGLAAENVAAAAAASLGRLGTDHIDLYYAHYDDANTPLQETASAFNDLVVSGRIRYIGVSNYTAERITEWINIATRSGFALPVALQPHYNLVHRTNYEQQLLPVVTANNLGVMPYYALASGFLTGKYRTQTDADGVARGQSVSRYLTPEGLALVAVLQQVADAHGAAVATVAIAWLRARSGVVAPIASASTVAQLPALMASATLELTPAQTAALDEASARVE